MDLRAPSETPLSSSDRGSEDAEVRRSRSPIDTSCLPQEQETLQQRVSRLAPVREFLPEMVDSNTTFPLRTLLCGTIGCKPNDPTTDHIIRIFRGTFENILICKCTHKEKGLIEDTPHYHFLLGKSDNQPMGSNVVGYWVRRIHEQLGDQVVREGTKGKGKVTIWNRHLVLQPNYIVTTPFAGMVRYIAIGMAGDRACKYDLYLEPNSKIAMIYYYANIQPGLVEAHRLKHPTCFGDEDVYPEEVETEDMEGTDHFYQEYREMFRIYGPLPHGEMMVSERLDHAEKSKLIKMSPKDRKRFDEVRTIWMQEQRKGKQWFELYSTYHPGVTLKSRELSLGLNFILGILKINKIDPCDFATTLSDLLSNKSGKKGTLYIWGVSNSGKTSLMKPVRDLMVFVGDVVQSSNWKYSNFKNCNLICLEEFNPSSFPKSNLGTLKKLFSGEEESFDLKFGMPFSIKDIPIIVTTNSSPGDFCKLVCGNDILSAQAMINRMVIYHFTTPFHNTFDVRCHPLAMIHFIQTYASKEDELTRSEITYQYVMGEDGLMINLDRIAPVAHVRPQPRQYVPPAPTRVFSPSDLFNDIQVEIEEAINNNDDDVSDY